MCFKMICFGVLWGKLYRSEYSISNEMYWKGLENEEFLNQDDLQVIQATINESLPIQSVSSFINQTGKLENYGNCGFEETSG